MNWDTEIQAHIDLLEEIKTGAAELAGAIRTGVTAADWYEDDYTARRALRGYLQTLEAATGRLCRALDGLPGDARDLLEALTKIRKEAKPT